MRENSRIMTYLIILLTIVLLFTTLTALSVNRAGIIRDKLVAENKAQFLDQTEQFTAIYRGLPENVSQEEARWQYSMMLRDFSQEERYSYDICSVAFLVGKTGNEVVFLGGRNMILAVLKEEDGSVSHIPMVFAQDNTADVAALMKDAEILNLNSDDTMQLTGYWDDDLFYLQRFKWVHRNYTVREYISPAATPEGMQEITYTTKAIRLYGIPKGGVGDSSFKDYASRWDSADKLLEDVRDWYLQGEISGRVWILPRDNLFSTVVVASEMMPNQNRTLGLESSIRYVYAVKFSPLGLAWKDLLHSGSLAILLAVYLGAMVLLLTAYHRFREAELRSYQDEITRQQQALSYARDAEASRREMTSAIAHELKTPIAVMSSYAEALQENIDAEKQAHYLSVIREEAEKMDRMVLELLDYSRLEAGKYRLQREDFDLEELVRQVLEPLEPQLQEKELKLEWQVDNPQVNADAYRMGQVVENFMTNAIRHTPKGGKIVIRIGTQRETLAVENQGSHIPAENLKKVWETFWQGDAARNERGSGLGLAICRTIISLHGGSCKVENTASGVCFSVSLEKEKKLFQLGRLSAEQQIELNFPIAQQYTTVESVMSRLGFAKGEALEQELREGKLLLGQERVKDRKTKLYPGYVLAWREYRITICLDDDNKRRMLLMERMRTGGLGSPEPYKLGPLARP